MINFYCRVSAPESHHEVKRGKICPFFACSLYLSDSQNVSRIYNDCVQEIRVLKLSKSMFDIVKHTV